MVDVNNLNICCCAIFNPDHRSFLIRVGSFMVALRNRKHTFHRIMTAQILDAFHFIWLPLILSLFLGKFFSLTRSLSLCCLSFYVSHSIFLLLNSQRMCDYMNLNVLQMPYASHRRLLLFSSRQQINMINISVHFGSYNSIGCLVWWKYESKRQNRMYVLMN